MFLFIRTVNSKNANLVTLRVRLYSGTSNNDVYINTTGSPSDYINLGIHLMVY